ncbi:hypothetical protein EJ06DRAFT_558303 [Trichodelitschia bisporula]|uniref:polynucleotide adenylyltransferase n=1 Tax=Trichodelitschia bisporula TaxID=703511 RepID=A0A6G1HRD7_9PEZI|nr:hypothetical protein EJ06DRAFT_558303 [Trichodelitschia bisporula]
MANSSRRNDAHRDRNDSYRPGRDRDGYRDRHPLPRRPDFNRRSNSPPRRHPQGPRGGDGFHFGGTDSYRPPQGDFTFRSDQQPKFQSEVPNGPRGRRRPYAPYAPHKANDRKILNALGEREPTPERLTGMTDGPPRFKDADEVFEDSPESDPESANGRPSKRAKGAEGSDVAPKWSNPDPYTVLPPEYTGPKKDVVKLIRKAKLEAADVAQARNSVVANDDFISFDDEPQAPVPEPGPNFVVQNGESPSFSHLKQLHPSINPPPPVQRPPPPSLTFHVSKQATTTKTRQVIVLDDDSAEEGLVESSSDQQISIPVVISDTEEEPSPLPNPRKRKGAMDARPTTMIPGYWASHGPERDPAPWVQKDHSSKPVDKWLHNEIIDLYEYLRPREHEKQIRETIIARVNTAISQTFPESRIRCFGSFPTGMYLPTGDLDLVMVSHQFEATGLGARVIKLNFMRRVVACLSNAGLLSPGSDNCITKARVPILKYKDRITGLPVDISFDNLGGVKAVDTYIQWLHQFPQLPVMTLLVKQFLLMRGLNEVNTGGLGGFSTVCLIVSRLQHLFPAGPPPPGAEHDMDLGRLLLDFFKFWGKEFKMQVNAISLNPPGYPRKKADKFGRNKWQIIDPNLPTNDISGGTSGAEKIKNLFSRAYDDITRRMSDLALDLPQEFKEKKSLLVSAFGGYYHDYEMQRKIMLEVSNEPVSPYDSFAPAPHSHLPNPPPRKSNNFRGRPPSNPRAPSAGPSRGGRGGGWNGGNQSNQGNGWGGGNQGTGRGGGSRSNGGRGGNRGAGNSKRNLYNDRDNPGPRGPGRR